jgi:ABC-type spermidine/putrescine transport system permease subunit II
MLLVLLLLLLLMLLPLLLLLLLSFSVPNFECSLAGIDAGVDAD